MATDGLSLGEGSRSSSQSLHLPSLASQSQACSILTCAIQHLFLAKGQIPDPISVLQSKRARERLAKGVGGSQMGSRPKGDSFAKRKRNRKVDEVNLQLSSKTMLSSHILFEYRYYLAFKDSINFLYRQCNSFQIFLTILLSSFDSDSHDTHAASRYWSHFKISIH